MTGAGCRASGAGRDGRKDGWRGAVGCVLSIGLLLAPGALCVASGSGGTAAAADMQIGRVRSEAACNSGEHNQLSDEEKEQGFKLLFDGKSMDRWRNLKSQTVRPQWRVIDGAMVMTAKGGRDLVTREEYAHFDLRLEYKIAEGGNSGIMFRVIEDTEERKPWRLAPEYQLYDSFTVKAKPERSAGALYGLVAAPRNLAKKPGEWNLVRILFEPAGEGRERLRFWLNGKPTVDIVVDHAPDSEWSRLIEKRNLEKKGTKFELPDGFMKAETGHILLQDHGARVAFRSIRIRRLPATGRDAPPGKDKQGPRASLRRDPVCTKGERKERLGASKTVHLALMKALRQKRWQPARTTLPAELL